MNHLLTLAEGAASDASLWTDLIRQAPSAAAVVVTVALFIRYLNSTSERLEKMDETKSQALTILGENCHAFQKDISERQAVVMNRSTEAIHKNSEVLGKVSGVLERVTSKGR